MTERRRDQAPPRDADEGAERMLRIVEAVPPGSAITYGDLAALAEWGGPRTAGRVLASLGSGVPWHRVVTADGRPPAHQASGAIARWLAEGTPLRPDGTRVDLTLARWTPDPA